MFRGQSETSVCFSDDPIKTSQTVNCAFMFVHYSAASLYKDYFNIYQQNIKMFVLKFTLTVLTLNLYI